MSPRYALYYVPPAETPLYRFGAGLLGYDAYTAEAVRPPEAVTAVVADWSDLVRAPRVYGFHATLKAPFALAAEVDEAALRAACAAFAATPRVVPIIEPAVALVAGFVALVPAQVPDALTQLAADCVRGFDAFRAPLTAADRARRDPAQLSTQQAAHLERWGYPHVMEMFQFHMTLTGRLPDAKGKAILTLLRQLFADLDRDGLAIDRLALLRQDAGGTPFRILAHWTLRERC